MTITDAWIAVGIFIIIFEVLFLILHCIFSAEYRRNIKKIDELGMKSEEEFRIDKEEQEQGECANIVTKQKH